MSEAGKPEEWQSEIVVCKDGLILNIDAITQGTTLQGSAKSLQNFECALEGGYRRISGYQKWDTATVPGDANTPVLGVKAALGGVFAARRVAATPTTDIYFSAGSGWGSRINTSNRGGNPLRIRFITYSINKPTIVGCDGVNPAFKYDGTTYTLLNGTDAPADPKYAEMFNASLALAGYSASPQNVIITAPNTDDDFAAADGAIEINVGDVVVALKNFRDTLYVFCLNRIFKIVLDSTTTYAVQEVTHQIGCISSDSIQEIGGDLIYLAPDGFRSVAGTFNIGDVDLSLQSRNIQPSIRDELGDLTNISVVSCTVKKKSQYRAFFYDSTVSKSSGFGVIGKVEQGEYLSGFNSTFIKYAWSTTLGIQPYCCDSYWENNQEVVVHGDPSNGYVYEQESGNDFDGSPINAIYSSPYLTFKDASLRKVIQKASIYTEVEGANTVNLALLFDFANLGVLQPPAIPLNITGSFPVFGIAIFGTDVFSGVNFPVFKQNLLGSGFTTQFQFTSTGGAPYRIDSYQIIYGLKGRR